MLLFSFFRDCVSVRHGKNCGSQFRAAGSCHLNLKASRRAVGGPASSSGLTIGIRPGSSRILLIWKNHSRPSQRETKCYIGAFHGPAILIQHLNDKRSHDPALQIIHLSIACKRNYFKTLH